MSRTIAGVMKWGSWGADHSTTAIEGLISGCVEKGINTFDHADIYGGYTTEEAWGKAWKNLSIPREDVQIITKCGICYPSSARPEFEFKYYDTSKEYIINAATRSIQNLHCEYLDLLLIHRPSPVMCQQEIAEAFHYLQEKGMVKNFGVSNFNMAQMELIRYVYPIRANQIEISLLHLDPFQDGTMAYCKTHDIEIQAWSPLGGGQLFTKSADYDFVTQRARLKEVADKYDWTLDEMAYLFLFHHPAGIRPVTGTSKLERITKVHDLEKHSISNKQWFEIWTASTGKKVP